jgi:predicted metalloprotease with PDZ domain
VAKPGAPVSGSPVAYRVAAADPAAHRLQVTCTVADPDPAGQVFRLPAWIPGSYLIREFARHVLSCRAEAGGVPLPVAKVDKQSWRCAPVDGPLTLVYEVYAHDLSVRGAYLDPSRAYFNGASVLVYPVGREGRPCSIEIVRPEGETARGWRVATSLARAGAQPWDFGTYEAVDYDELIDHPVEIGQFDLVEFTAQGVPHQLALTGRHRADPERLARDLRRVCEYQIGLFGEPAPFGRFLFLVTAVGEGYGGLEHRASTSLICRREDLPRAGESAVSDGYRTFLGLASHEYFHAWLVKRIRPAAFTPYDLTREQYTTLLWAFEGITSYYDDLALVRAGVIEPEDYLQLLGETATRVWRTPGRARQTLAESSLDAWTKFYRPDENSPNAVVSYYAKGALAALALDLTLRRRTGGARSLDDVLRGLWARYGRTGRGVPEDGVERLAEEVAGAPLGDLFDRLIRGTDDPPLRELLAGVGVDFRLRAAESQDDKGGRTAGRSEWQERAVLGARTEAADGGARLVHVYDGGAARAAGLTAGDLVVAVEGLRVSHATLERTLGGYAPDSTVRVHAFRRDELIERPVTLGRAPLDTCVLSLNEDADEVTRRAREAWLRGGPAPG